MTERKTRPTKWFWIISLILLIWNILGLMMFIHQMTISPEELAELSQVQQDLLTSSPVWVTIAFTTAVFTGVLGCLGLLLKRRWAKPLVLISLLAVIAQMSHTLFLTNAMETMEGASAIMPISIIIVGIFMLLFSNYTINKGWLK